MKGPEIGHGSIVCWSSAAVATQVNDEVVLMNLERDRCYGLGSTGSEIWRRIQSPIQVGELSTQLEGEFDAEPGQIEVDLLRTLRELAAEGLIQVVSASE
jgi:Coenzyme PQQ synthesis protein D (PqqD)